MHQETSFRKHEHAKTTQPSRNLSVHQVFGTRQKIYTIIQETPSHPIDMNDAVKQALALWKIQQGAFLDNFNSLSRNDAGKTPWMDRTQFPHYLDGLTTQEIIGILADNPEIDTKTQLLYEAFHAMVAESFKHAETIPHILHKFLSAHNLTLPDKGILLSQTSTTADR
jgi:hypothetical protein